MGKRLVVCCDGTWNTPDQTSPTNVTKLALAVAERGSDGTDQRVFYVRGVGTTRWERLRGGAFGLGLSRNVKEAYRFLVDSYEPGDELFLFGFSRGAFTARSTAGLVRKAGILHREQAGRIDQAYRLYRDRVTHPRDVEAQLFRRTYSHEPRIRLIGVWDTVGALGIPLSGLRLINAFNRRWQFHDTDLSTTVDAAFHAVAIDEQRKAFAPTLWQQQPDATEQRLEQVWFAGSHCDVGGGYPQTGLSDLALLWMADRARSCGLTFRDDAFPTVPPPGGRSGVFTVQPDPFGPLHDSRRAVFRLLPAHHRPIGVTDPGHEHAAASAVQRHDKDPGYAPPALVSYLAGEHQVLDIG